MKPFKPNQGFNTIPEGKIDIMSRERILGRQTFSQWTQIAGGNKNIEMIDEVGNKRIFIGEE